MNFRLDNFFENPNLLSLIAIIAIVVGYTLSVYFQHRNRKKIQNESSKNSNSVISAISNLTNKITILIDKEVNSVNLPSAEAIIESVLRKSEAAVKNEVRRVFFHNHRLEATRQTIIKKALASVTQTAFNNDMNTLSKFFYREKSLAEFLINIETKDFFSGLILMTFNKSNYSDTDLQDTLYYIESQFNSYITNAKSYYSNL